MHLAPIYINITLCGSRSLYKVAGSTGQVTTLLIPPVTAVELALVDDRGMPDT
jgi:hypothetical protein